jgi:hypothetical protein
VLRIQAPPPAEPGPDGEMPAESPGHPSGDQ